VFMPAEILGLLAPWRWLAGLAGVAWGAVCSFGLGTVNAAAHELPVDFITALQQISTPILWLFSMFPVLAVARQFGRPRGFITLPVEPAMIVLATTLWPDMFAGSLAMAAGVVMLLIFALVKDRAARIEEKASVAAMGAEEQAAAADAQASSDQAVDQLFGPNAQRLRKNMVWFALLGGAVAALSATHIFGGG